MHALPSSPSPVPAFQPRHLHVAAFAQAHASLQGAEPLAHYPRLARESLASGAALTLADAVQWQATGSTVQVAGAPAQIWLHVSARATLDVQCQRCLEPMAYTLSVARDFCFAADEASAQRLDAETDADVLVLSRDFDVYALIEDELLMALPLAPMHSACPTTLPTQVQSADFDAAAADTPHPFAALQALKGKS